MSIDQLLLLLQVCHQCVLIAFALLLAYGEWVRLLRARTGLDQEDFAELLKLCREEIHRIETGKVTNPRAYTRYTLRVLEKALEYDSILHFSGHGSRAQLQMQLYLEDNSQSIDEIKSLHVKLATIQKRANAAKKNRCK